MEESCVTITPMSQPVGNICFPHLQTQILPNVWNRVITKLCANFQNALWREPASHKLLPHIYRVRKKTLVSTRKRLNWFLSGNTPRPFARIGIFLVFLRRHHCSIFTTHWAMTLFSNVRYTSTLTVVTGTPLFEIGCSKHI